MTIRVYLEDSLADGYCHDHIRDNMHLLKSALKGSFLRTEEYTDYNDVGSIRGWNYEFEVDEFKEKIVIDFIKCSCATGLDRYDSFRKKYKV